MRQRWEAGTEARCQARKHEVCAPSPLHSRIECYVKWVVETVSEVIVRRGRVNDVGKFLSNASIVAQEYALG